MDNESGQMADSGGQHPQSMKCVDATGAMLRSDMAGDDDGETVTDSEERPQDEDEAKLVQQRAQQKRRFTAARTSLEREFGKDNPSLRYLKKGLCEAEEILGHIEAIVISQRQLLERQNNLSRLAVLVDWESKLKNECELLAEVSSLLENAPSSNLHSDVEPQNIFDSDSYSHAGELDYEFEPQASLHDHVPIVSDAVSDCYRTASGLSQPYALSAAHVNAAHVNAAHVNAAHVNAVSSASASPADMNGSADLSNAHQAASPVQVQYSNSAGPSPMATHSHAVISSASSSMVSAGMPNPIGAAPLLVSSMQSTRPMSNPVMALPSRSGNPSTVTNQPLIGNLPRIVPRTGRPVPMAPVPAVGTAMPDTKISSSQPPLPSRSGRPQASRVHQAGMQPVLSAGLQYGHGVAGPSSYYPAGYPYQSPMYQMAAMQPPPPIHHMGQHYPVMQPMSLPHFSGKSQEYARWKSRFLQFMPSYLPEEYRMERLREAVAGGSSESLIASLIDGPGVYTTTWKELDSWHGGSDRNLEHQLRAIIEHPKILNERDVDGLTKYAITLRSTLANMTTCGMQPGVELCLMATEKVPKSMLVRYFERHGDGNTDVVQFSEWLINRLKTLKRANDRASTAGSAPQPTQKPHKTRTLVGSTTPAPHCDASSSASNSSNAYGGRKFNATNNNKCRKCLGPHSLAYCRSFKELPVAKRVEFVRLLGVCNNCLREGHWARKCSATTCAKCSRSHHTLLHLAKSEESSSQGAPAQHGPETQNKSSNTAHGVVSDNVSFMTVPVQVTSGDKRVQVTAILDSGSSCTYVSQEVANALNLEGPLTTLETSVLGGSKIVTESKEVQVQISRQDNDSRATVSAFVIPQVTRSIETIDWNATKYQWPHLNDIEFASPADSNIDILIGIDSPELHAVMDERRGQEGEPIARLTPLGWVCFGSVATTSDSKTLPCSTTVMMSTTDSDDNDLSIGDMVRKLFELEMRQSTYDNTMSLDEQAVEKKTTASLRNDDSRITMQIPWKSDAGPNVTANRGMAERRLTSLRQSLQRRPEVAAAYQQVITTCLEKGYIREVPTAEIEENGYNQWFLPHFPVVKNDRSTTKVWIVFDAAAQKNGSSINDSMFAGPALQNNLVGCILRFCKEPVAIIGDVSEMFLQVGLAESDRKYHRFLWEKDGQQVIYEFQRLCFGIKASPYLACRALREIANTDNKAVTQVVMDDMYVDDLISSVEDPETAINLRQDIQQVLDKGGFHLRKWLSNSEQVMDSIPVDDRSTAATVNIQEGTANQAAVKTLGVSWSATDDYFTFVHCVPNITQYTKRTVLSKMASIFDPRGQVSPYTIRAKVLFQEACLKGIGWDEPFSPDQAKQWKQFFQELPQLADIKADRCFKSTTRPPSDATLTVHTFVDASDCAVAAACYIRATYLDGHVRTTLAMAKAKPAPLHRQSIPMLELRAAVLGTQVTAQVLSALRMERSQVFYWSDSMNVLHWVRSHSRKFKVDVGNRVAEIQSASDPEQWRHVPTRVNPADKATRGMSAQQLAADPTWWHGPQFLQDSEDSWPAKEIVVPKELPGELKRRPAMSFLIRKTEQQLDPVNFSAWQRLVRVTAWCRRWLQRRKTSSKNAAPGATEGVASSNAKDTAKVIQVQIRLTKNGQAVRQKVNRVGRSTEEQHAASTILVPALTVDECTAAEEIWIRQAQGDAYGSLLDKLKESTSCLSKTHELVKLQPYLDSDGMLRVGGRLQTAHHLPHAMRHPVILPSKHPVTELIIADVDLKHKHCAGTNHLATELSARFWIVHAVQTIKRTRLRCHGCQRHRNKAAAPLMAPLPGFRTAEPWRAFERVGVDYAGPFLTRQGRGKVQTKRYLCLFTCLQTRAVHLELVYSMTTDGFLQAFGRFSHRRGTPSFVISDNGSNFVAAEKELRQAVKGLDKT